MVKILRCRSCYGGGDTGSVPCLICKGRGLIEDNEANTKIIDATQAAASKLMEQDPTPKNMEKMRDIINAADAAITEAN